jgi:hypothetical protein
MNANGKTPARRPEKQQEKKRKTRKTTKMTQKRTRFSGSVWRYEYLVAKYIICACYHADYIQHME